MKPGVTGAADAVGFITMVEASPMKRFALFCAVPCAALLFLGACETRASNVQFNFNSDADGWTFGTIPATGSQTPWWEWHKAPSSTDGGLQAKMSLSDAGVGAWAMSPCLELDQNNNQPYIHVDISHLWDMPEGVLGQVQFQVDTGSGFGTDWLGIPTAAWDASSGHHPPTEAVVFAPLLSSSGSPNDWLAFEGTSAGAGSGSHLTSSFTLQWGDYGLAQGDDIRFRLLVGTNKPFREDPAALLWEMNIFQVEGAKVCAVPEPGSLAMAGAAAACGIGGIARRRLARPSRAANADRHER